MKESGKKNKPAGTKDQKKSFFNRSGLLSDPFIQPKLSINQPGDKFEKEADEIADQVVKNTPEPSSFFSPAPQVSAKFFEPGKIHRKGLLKDPEDEIQRSEGLSDTPSVPSSFESSLSESNGSGQPLSDNVKASMRNRMGADFSNVGIHNNAHSASLSNQINAKAFTHGSDIYFNQGQYQPETREGQHLLAHELTHTLQQNSGLQRDRIQREGEEVAAPPEPSHEFADATVGEINTSKEELTIPNLEVPGFKQDFYKNNSLFNSNYSASRFKKTPRSGNHLTEWEKDAMAGEGFTSKFDAQVEKENAPNLLFNGNRIYYLVLRRGSNKGSEGVIFGDKETVRRRISRPYWTRGGEYTNHQVDHKVELQTGGRDTDTQNLWMLEASANMSSGSRINNSLESKITAILNAAPKNLINKPNLAKVKDDYTINTKTALRALPGKGAGDPRLNYDLDKVQAGDHLKGLKFLSESEVEKAGLRGAPNELVIYTNRTGGIPIRIPWNEQAQESGRKDGINRFIGKRGGANARIDSVIYNSSTSGENEGQGGSGGIACTLFSNSKEIIEEKNNVGFEIRPIDGVSYGGYITRESIVEATRESLVAKFLSPITLDDAELSDQGLTASGKIVTGIPIIDGAEIELVVDPSGARFRKLFTSEEFDLPSPFSVSNSTLEVSAGTGGFGINGEMNFEIKGVGEGYVRAGANSKGGFSLAGGFNFDSQLFDPARIDVAYDNEQLSISGEIGIPEGKIRGIKSATITAAYHENTFTAQGTAQLDVPGIEQGNLSFTFGETGWAIGGGFDLSSDVPGIRSGRVEATVTRKEGEEGYNVTASGTAQPDIPGIDSTLSISYENGIFDISGSVAYDRGMLAGSVNLGVTNRGVDETGEPTGEPSENLIVYGGGSLTLTLTPWLKATAGVQFLPNGEIEIRGRIALPDTVDVFDRRKFEKTLFRAPTLEIPIFAIPLGPKSIGIVATINGSLSLSAGFGPGQLQELYGEVTYNPDHPEQTTLAGGGRFVIPADAGLTLSADVGVGASVAIASLTGGIELTGSLGLEGEAAAQVNVNWNPQSGVELKAKGSIIVNPKFTFEVNALVRAKLSLLVTSISKVWRYNLASFDWGPDIRFGVIFPIHYIEGEPFDISFDDVEFITPNIDIPKMAKDLAINIKNRIF